MGLQKRSSHLVRTEGWRNNSSEGSTDALSSCRDSHPKNNSPLHPKAGRLLVVHRQGRACKVEKWQLVHGNQTQGIYTIPHTIYSFWAPRFLYVTKWSLASCKKMKFGELWNHPTLHSRSYSVFVPFAHFERKIGKSLLSMQLVIKFAFPAKYFHHNHCHHQLSSGRLLLTFLEEWDKWPSLLMQG